MKKHGWSLILLAAIVLTACGNRDRADLPPEPEEGVLIYAGLNPMDKALELQIERFNEEHTDVQIQFRDYSDEGGPQRLLVELAAGRVPDIMELQRIGREDSGDVKNVEVLWYTTPLEADLSGVYWMPYRQMVQKGYLEDLWPYIENDPELGREGVLENPLKLSEVDGGLYMLFGKVEINTMVSSPELVGDRTGWTLQELRDAFAAMPEGSTVLSFNTSREEIAGSLLRYSADAYVDREAGTCSFDDPSFRSLMEFVQMLPGIEEVEEEIGGIDYIDVLRDARSRQQKGLQLLEEIDLTFRELQLQDMLWGGRCALIGYPTEDGSNGSTFRPRGPQLGISASCENKEAAWEFVRTVMTGPAGSLTDTPLKREQYEIKRNTSMTVKAPVDFDPVTHEEITAPPLTEERAREFDDFFNSIDKIEIWDGPLMNLIYEICDPYFAGAKDLDETIRLLQNRVGLYLSEQV